MNALYHSSNTVAPLNAQLILITPPDDDVITVDQLKANLRKEDNDQDTLLQDLIDQAVSLVDPAHGGNLGRALRPQTWELQLASFPCGQIELPFPPLITLDSVKYDDPAGVEHTLVVDTNFRMFGQGGLYKTILLPPYNSMWPTSRCDIGSVRIRFTSGYDPADDNTAEGLPPGIRAYLLLFAGGLFDGNAAGLPDGSNIERLLDRWRVYTSIPVVKRSNECLTSLSPLHQ